MPAATTLSDRLLSVEQVTLTLKSVNPDTGTVSPTGVTKHNKGSRVTIVATPRENYVFSYWEGDVAEQEATTTVLMDRDKEITAYFGM